MEQYFPVGCTNRSPSKFRAKIQNKPKQTNGGLVASFTCFDDFEIKTNNILSEDDDFIKFSVQLAVTCEGI